MSSLSFWDGDTRLAAFSSKYDKGDPWAGIPRRGDAVRLRGMVWIVSEVIWEVSTGFGASADARVQLTPRDQADTATAP